MFFERRDLFTGLDLIFFDTTSIYFEGEGGETLGRRGHSRDHRPDLNQMVVGAVIDSKGKPVCCEMWPGNRADVKSLIPAIERIGWKRSTSLPFRIFSLQGPLSRTTGFTGFLILSRQIRIRSL